jgi:iron complex outermembrane receptor protein
LSLCLLATGAAGQSAGDEDLAALEELMAILDQETTAATKTKLNSDYVPGMVTVLQGEDLEALGKATVWEALALVPGLQTYQSPAGEPFVTVRGVPFPFNSGNIKVLVNSISMSRETSSVNPSVLLLPVDQVDRIEVVRSPSSSVYGDFAFLGVVNIITQKGETGGFASLIDGEHVAAGAQLSKGGEQLRVDLNVAVWTSSEGEGPVDQEADEDRVSAIAEIAYGPTSLSYQLFDRTYADALDVDERNQAVDLRHRLDLPGLWYADVNANVLSTTADAGVVFEGDAVRGQANLGWATEDTDYLFSLAVTDANIDHAELSVPGRPQDDAIIANDGWEAVGASAQGSFHLRPDLSATVGARVDHRIDLERQSITPRLAVVWRSRRAASTSSRGSTRPARGRPRSSSSSA